ncbi:hypothetical protein B0H16DRAFT_1490240, partial [Mycena metata]
MSFLREPRRRQQPFLLLQSSGSYCQLLEDASGHAVLFCLLHSSLLSVQGSHLKTHDLLHNVPGYSDNYEDPRKHIQSAALLGSFCTPVSPSPLLPLLSQPRFSPSLTHVNAHPPALLIHLSTEYLTLPPPLSPEAKFWGIFLPVSERVHESERLIFGPDGEGTGDTEELVIEVIVRGDAEGSRRRGVDRTLQGWSLTRGPCPLPEITALKSLWSRNIAEPIVVDPTQNVSFNLNLTESQQNSRAQVPLPYAHEGKPMDKPASAAIFYDPDSGDDIDDDDPDEDLDI